jgi:Zn-dependent protease with chaperone function
VAGNACTPQVYRSELYQLGVAAVLVLVAAGALVAAWRWGHRVQRSRRRTLAHGRMARLVGRPLVARGSAGTGAVVLEDPRPAAYCAAGTIVVTRGALDILDEAQLAVVLAHEQGHLRGRHHVLYLVTRGLSAAFPGVPLFGAGERAVARLTEMSADDAAIRASGGTAGGTSSRNAADARGGTGFTVRATLVSALVALATGEAAPGSAGPGKGAGPGEALIPRTALAAASYAVQARVERMLAAPTRRAAVSHAAALAALTLALAAVPAAFLALAA